MPSFCSQETLQFDEPIAGSAVQVKRYLFIGWPRGGWEFSHVIPKNAPDGLVETIDQIDTSCEAEVRLFKYPHSDNTSAVIFCPEMVMVSGIPLNQLPNTIRDYLDGTAIAYPQEQLQGEHLFLCTHGKRDKCCAKFGYATALTLNQHLKDNSTKKPSYSIWETSHLVGDRFAGTGIHFPSGNMYGRLNPGVAIDVLEKIDHDDVYLPCFRGNIFLDEQKQVVDALSKAYLQEQQLTGTVTIEQQQENSYSLSIETEQHRHSATVVLKQKEYSFYSNCKQLDEHIIHQKNRWVSSIPTFEISKK